MKLRSLINSGLASIMGVRFERVRPPRHARFDGAHPMPICPIEELSDLRLRTGAWIYSAPVSRMVGRPIFGYGQYSWHPFVASCQELLRDIDAPYESSTLRKFYESFTPQTVAEAYQLPYVSPLDTVPALSQFEPWLLGAPPFDNPYSSDFPPGSPLFGPIDEKAGEVEWGRLKRCVRSIMKYGYQPSRFPKGRINVVVLCSQEQERYLVVHGQHRAAVLAAMGVERIEVGTRSNVPPLVDETEAHTWPHVRSGFLTQDVAVAMLRRYFTTPASDPALKIAAATHGTSPKLSIGR